MGVWLYQVIDTIRDSLPFMCPGSDLDMYTQLCNELSIRKPTCDASIYESHVSVAKKHSVFLEFKGSYAGFKLEVRQNINAPYNGVFLFCRDFMSLIAWMNLNCLTSPYKSDLLDRFSGSMSTIKEVKHSLPYSDCGFF